MSAVALQRPAALTAEGSELRVLDARSPTLRIADGSACVAYCREGRLRVTLAHAQPELQAGEALLAGPESAVGFSVLAGSSALVLRIDADLLRETLQRLDATRRFDPPWLTAVHHAARALGDALAALQDSGAQPAGRLAAITEALQLDRRYDPLQARCPGRTAAQRRAVLARFERTRMRFAYSEEALDADVERMAACTSYTRWHFIRCFSAIYGESPAEYLREVRLQWCATQLERTDLAVSEIAWMAGYGSHASFARAFRSHYGRCASEWRYRRAPEAGATNT